MSLLSLIHQFERFNERSEGLSVSEFNPVRNLIRSDLKTHISDGGSEDCTETLDAQVIGSFRKTASRVVQNQVVIGRALEELV